MILTQTPYRVSLFGGGSDYPEHFREHGGATLGMAIDKFCYVGVKSMPPGQERSPGVPLRYRVQYSRVDDCVTRDEIRHPAVRGALQYYGIDEPLEFHCFGDLPGRAGLGGSSAFTVGLAHALRVHGGINRLPVDAEVLARDAISIEREVVKEAVGFQDQITCTLGGVRAVEYTGEDQWASRCIPLRPEFSAVLVHCLLLAYTGTMRDAHAMAARQIEALPQRVRVVRRMVAQAREWALHFSSEVILSPTALGAALREAWELKKAIMPEITTPDIDALYERGLKLGATGGKLLGAGGGGFFLFCVLPEHRDAFVREIDVPCVAFNVCTHGTRVIIPVQSSLALVISEDPLALRKSEDHDHDARRRSPHVSILRGKG